VPFLVIFEALMLFVLHGTSALKIFGILGANYAIAKALGGSIAAPVTTWVFNGAVLFMNERHAGYKFGSLNPALEVLVSGQNLVAQVRN
jgi:hypothetical protein